MVRALTLALLVSLIGNVYQALTLHQATRVAMIDGFDAGGAWERALMLHCTADVAAPLSGDEIADCINNEYGTDAELNHVREYVPTAFDPKDLQ